MEPLADECTGIFLAAMGNLAGEPVDLRTWLQWYAFDVIGAISGGLGLWRSGRTCGG